MAGFDGGLLLFRTDAEIERDIDRIERTIDYFAVAQMLLKYGEGRSWKLLERLVTQVADEILTEFKAQAVNVEVKKFIIPGTRYVSVTLSQPGR